jgi:phosphotransferase system  glucose/maltose/N-acetylglucosamine-specific IIC component
MICCFPIIGIFGLLATIFWIWMIVDCATNEPSISGNNDKIVWILVIVLTHFVGALIYFLIRRPERMRDHGR